MSFLGQSNSSKNSTTINNDNRTQNNSAAADGGSSVLSSAGGELTNQAGAIVSGGGTVNLSTSDKGSFQLASDIADRAFSTVASGNAAVAALAGQTTDTTAKLAQGTPIGTDWKRLVLPLAAIAAVLGFLFLRMRKAH